MQNYAKLCKIMQNYAMNSEKMMPALCEKHRWPWLGLFLGNLKSFPVLRRPKDEYCEFSANNSHRYCGSSSFKDLKTMVLDLLVFGNLPIVFSSQLFNKRSARSIEAAICYDPSSTFLKFRYRSISVDPEQPQTRQLWIKSCENELLMLMIGCLF